MKRFAFFAALACAPLTAPAQVALTPTGSVDVNPGFFYILNIHEYLGFLALTDVELLWTYEYPPHRDPEWIKVYAYSSMAFRTYVVSWSLVDPSDPRRMLFSTVKAGRSTIVGQTILPGGWWTQEEMDLGPAENAGDVPAGLAGSPNGTLYVAKTSGIQIYAGFAATPTLTRSLAPPTELSFGSVAPQLQFGADNVLYALDTENDRVLRFSEEGDFLNSFDVASDSFSFLVSDGGFLFMATNSDENVRDGYIYDALTGAFVGTFDVPEDYADARAGRGSMTFYGDSLYLISPRGTQLHSYDVSGFTAIPEPSTYAALLGAGALGFACWRRRRAKITLN